MNHCPVYQNVGGHSYGWVYPGPIGSILTPMYVGLENAQDLPPASTFCNQCGVVCPVKIPLPDLQRKLREEQWERGFVPWYEPVAMSLWGSRRRRPSLYAFGARIAVRVLNWVAGSGGAHSHFRSAAAGPQSRDFPAPSGRTFHDMYRERRDRLNDSPASRQVPSGDTPARPRLSRADA